MKKIVAAVVLFASLFGVYGQDKTFELKPEVLTKVLDAGSPLKMTFKVTAPKEYVPRAWRLVAYVPNIPANFSQVTGCKVIPHKMKEWSSVTVMAWDWSMPADKILVKDTAKWPKGDYRMALYILLEAKGADNKLKHKYLNENVLFTVK